MTREEAIENFKSMIEAKSQLNAYGVNNKYDFRVGNNFFNALDMAIKALETLEEFEKAQIITGGRLNGRTYAYKCGLEDGKRKALEQEPCEDCIIREEILKKAFTIETKDMWHMTEEIKVVEVKDVLALPSVQPIRPKGEWIETTVRGSMSLVCSKCGADLGSICETNFCPDCGAKMESEE